MDNRVTRIIFWVAFTSFLCASIPHVAWIFDQFERGSDNQIVGIGPFQFDFWQGLSYLIAISIDALVMWLSFQLSIGKSKVDAGMTWTFILILSALSWYCNWLYSLAHSPAAHIDIWSLPILWGLTTVGTFTPIIVSAFPVFSIGYTFMLSRLSKASMSPDELREQLEAKKKLADVRKEYASDRNRLASLLKQGIHDIADVTTVAKDAISQVRQGQVTPALTAMSNGSIPPVTPALSEESNGSIAVVTPIVNDISEESTDTSTEDIEPIYEASNPQSEIGSIEDLNESSNGSTSRRYVHIDEAVKLLSYDISYVKSLRTKGVLKTQSKNADMITMASINTVLTKKVKGTTKLPKVVSIHTDRDTGEMEVQPSIPQSNPVDTSIDTTVETVEYESSLVVSH